MPHPNLVTGAAIAKRRKVMSPGELRESTGWETHWGILFLSSWAFNTNVSEIDLVWDLKAADFPWIFRPRCLLLASLPQASQHVGVQSIFREQTASLPLVSINIGPQGYDKCAALE